MRLTIGTKLIALVTLLLLSAEVVVVSLSTQLFIEDNSALIQQMNAESANGLATQVRAYLDSYLSRLEVLGDIWLREAERPQSGGSVVKRFFESQEDVIMLRLYGKDAKGNVGVRAEYFAEELTGNEWQRKEQDILLTPWVHEAKLNRAPAIKEPRVIVTKFGAVPALALVMPLPGGPSVVAWINFTKLAEPLRQPGVAGSYLVDSTGAVLLRSDGRKPALSERVAPLLALKKLRENNVTNGQTVYEDPRTNDRRLVAFRAVGPGDLAIVSEVPESKAFEAVERLRFRAEMVAIVVLCISLVAGYYYSETISAPLRELAEAAERISAGDYNIKLVPRTRDEVADLALAFNAMAEGLEERNMMKETFNKYHNKEIAEKLLSAKVRLGGERKDATILFMDIRDFTSLTENMEPEKVVDMLNEYMTRMVALIRTYGGIVDKYIGDAIMALWGIPEGHPDDAAHAVRCCLEIREELHRFNSLRVSRGEVPLRIGMGLNSGRVVAGNIGSPKKMEYTVVGDAVNVAARIETTTKEYHTDLLISGTVLEKVGRRFVIEPCDNAKVKGRFNEVEIYKVKGYIAENGKPVIVPENQVHVRHKVKATG